MVKWPHSYTSYVHLAGTKEDRDSAAVVRDQWSELLNLEKATKRDDGFFDAGSRQSIKHLTERGQGDRVWVDTYYSVCCHTRLAAVLDVNM